MKSIDCMVLILALAALAACGGKPAAPESTAEAEPAEDSLATSAETVAQQDEVPASYRQVGRARQEPKPFEAVLEDGKVRFALSSPNQAEGNLLTVVPSGLAGRNDTLQLQVEGYVQEAFKADLNRDGFIEVYAVTYRGDAQAKEQLHGFSSYRNKSYGPITVYEPDAAAMAGYQGQGRFYLGDDGQLRREFPLFDAAGQPTGRKRLVHYELQHGETSFILQPVKSETLSIEEE
jgi:predicted small lipoprotein YifL